MYNKNRQYYRKKAGEFLKSLPVPPTVRLRPPWGKRILDSMAEDGSINTSEQGPLNLQLTPNGTRLIIVE